MACSCAHTAPAPSGSCGCDTVRFPQVEKVLLAHIAEESAAGRPWYISPELNSQRFGRVVVRGNRMGDAGDVMLDIPPNTIVSDPEDGLGTMFTTSTDVSGNSGSFWSSLINTGGKIGSAAINAIPGILKTAGTLNALNHSQATQAGLYGSGIALNGNLATNASLAALQDQQSAKNNQLILVGLAFLAVMLVMQKGR